MERYFMICSGASNFRKHLSKLDAIYNETSFDVDFKTRKQHTCIWSFYSLAMTFSKELNSDLYMIFFEPEEMKLLNPYRKRFDERVLLTHLLNTCIGATY